MTVFIKYLEVQSRKYLALSVWFGPQCVIFSYLTFRDISHFRAKSINFNLKLIWD